MADKEHVKGALKEAEGNVKKAVGEATDDTSMKVKGEADKAEGKARKTAGDVKDKFKD